MPYIPPTARAEIDSGVPPRTAGEFNYKLSRILVAYRETAGENYQTYNDILGAIEAAKLEAYRLLIGPYEDLKRQLNGALPGTHDVAWAAGFFDGEGNCNYTRQLRRDLSPRPKGRMQMSVSQKEPLLLQRFREAVGGVGYIREMRATAVRKFPIWTWALTRFDEIENVIERMWPFLGVIKRTQALSALWRRYEERDIIATHLPKNPLEDWPEAPAQEGA